MSETANIDVSPSRRHIIKRPRLTNLLDETKARCILLVAPAGYGKTTLVHEWLAGSRRAAWFRCTSGAGDASAVALGLATVAAQVMDGVGSRLRERLRVTDLATGDLEDLLRLLVEDLSGWPADAWLVMDDYQRLIGHEQSEALVARLFETANIPLCVTSRVRPSWITARDLLYGYAHEFGPNALAMTAEESALLLGPESSVSAVADGWPAVIGLAAHSDRSVIEEAGEMPSELYEYFAEELYRAAEPALQLDLQRLAVAPHLTTEFSTGLLGADRFGEVVARGEELGFFSLDGSRIHPLLRQFLITKLHERGRRTLDGVVVAVARLLITHGRWDDAFEVAASFSADALLAELVEAALSDLLMTGRSGTLEEWLRYAAERGVSAPALQLAEAHVALRRGSVADATMLAVAAARSHRLASHALATAGRAAHLSLNEWEALDFHSRAEACARTEWELREAVWGQFLSASDLELTESPEILKRFETLVRDLPEGQVQLAAGRLTLAVQRGGIDDAVARAATTVRVLGQPGDPMARSSFLNSYADALAVGARYREAIELAERAIEVMTEYALDFAKPYAELVRAAALCGLRQTAPATDIAERVAAECGALDSYVLVNARIVTARASLISGDANTALAATPDIEYARIGRSLTGQYLATRALALATLNRQAEALETAERARAGTTSLEAHNLAAWASVAATSVSSQAVSDLVLYALHCSFVRGDRSSFVTAYRAIPNLLEHAVSARNYREPLRLLLTNLGERDLAKIHDIELLATPVRTPRHSDLSRRESEVAELLLQGLTNRQIASTLFISEVTVKAHLRHIYAKLNVRSRTEAALSLMRRLDPPQGRARTAS